MIKNLEELFYKKKFSLETSKDIFIIRNKLLKLENGYEIILIDIPENSIIVKKSNSNNFKIKIVKNSDNNFYISIYTKLNLFIILYLLITSIIIIFFFNNFIANIICFILLILVPIYLSFNFSKKTKNKFDEINNIIKN
ncbi:MAG: hypothetical protein ACK4IX_05215 [Candidatus Sericytochromatia bacterium]